MDSLMTRLVLKLITDNHDLQYRHRWKPDDIMIWDK
jgi:alpha-ketoglutarate-dependent taurine dioxygenase